jgi:hypothetical protein
VSHLRPVGPGETPPPETPKSIAQAVENGSSRDVLAAMRRALAQKLDGGDISSNAIASAYKELRELDRLIRQHDAEAIEAARENDAGRTRKRRSFDASAI